MIQSKTLAIIFTGIALLVPIFTIQKEPETILGVGYVSSEVGLRVRAKPSADAEKVATLSFAKQVLIQQESEKPDIIDGAQAKWLRIRREDLTGWVFGAYISRVPQVEDHHKKFESIKVLFQQLEGKSSEQQLALLKNIQSRLKRFPQDEYGTATDFDFAACRTALLLNSCDRHHRINFMPSAAKLRDEIMTGIRAKDVGRILQYADCNLAIGCWECDSYWETSSKLVAERIIALANMIDWASTYEYRGAPENRRVIHAYASSNPKTPDRDYFGIELKKAPSGWYLTGLMGNINNKASFEVCGSGR